MFVLVGGTVEKISDKLNLLFANADFTLAPSSAMASIYGVKVYMLLIKSVDYLGVQRTFMCMWNGDKWFIGSQISTLLLIAAQEVASVLKAWGSTSTNLFQMFTIFAIGAGLTYTLGRMTGSQRHGWAVWAAMAFLSCLAQCSGTTER